MTTHPTSSAPPRLEGWGAIALHLGVSERTAQRRASHGGIRVHRVAPWPGARKSFVWADPRELVASHERGAQ